MYHVQGAVLLYMKRKDVGVYTYNIQLLNEFQLLCSDG